MRQGAFDGKARLDEQDIDGVDAEVLYPSQRTMSAFMAQPDSAYHLAGVDAYNQWMWEEFSAADRTRLIGLYQMPAVDMESTLARIEEAPPGADGLPGGQVDLEAILARVPGAADAHVQAVILGIVAFHLKLCQVVFVQQLGEGLDEGHVTVMGVFCHWILEDFDRPIARRCAIDWLAYRAWAKP
jgi:hypothetical protein